MQNFDEYIIQGEPSQKEKAQIWQTAIGLQDVDGLKVSDYLIETAKENIEGKITIGEVIYRVDNYYKQQINRENIENRTDEADKVSANIANILSEKTFSFPAVENTVSLICSGDILEKDKKAQIGEVRERQGQKWKKVSDDKWVIVIESKEK